MQTSQHIPLSDDSVREVSISAVEILLCLPLIAAAPELTVLELNGNTLGDEHIDAIKEALESSGAGEGVLGDTDECEDPDDEDPDDADEDEEDEEDEAGSETIEDADLKAASPAGVSGLEIDSSEQIRRESAQLARIAAAEAADVALATIKSEPLGAEKLREAASSFAAMSVMAAKSADTSIKEQAQLRDMDAEQQIRITMHEVAQQKVENNLMIERLSATKEVTLAAEAERIERMQAEKMREVATELERSTAAKRADEAILQEQAERIQGVSCLFASASHTVS